MFNNIKKWGNSGLWHPSHARLGRFPVKCIFSVPSFWHLHARKVLQWQRNHWSLVVQPRLRSQSEDFHPSDFFCRVIKPELITNDLNKKRIGWNQNPVQKSKLFQQMHSYTLGSLHFCKTKKKNVSTCAIYKITRFYGHVANPLVVQTGTGSHKVICQCQYISGPSSPP